VEQLAGRTRAGLPARPARAARPGNRVRRERSAWSWQLGYGPRRSGRGRRDDSSWPRRRPASWRATSCTSAPSSSGASMCCSWWRSRPGPCNPGRHRLSDRGLDRPAGRNLLIDLAARALRFKFRIRGRDSKFTGC